MRTTITSLATAILLIGAVANGGIAASDVPADDGIGPVYVESTDILYLESWPVQVVLNVRGNLPTPCHELAYEVQDLGDRIDVLLWSTTEPGGFCAAVLEPFEVAIPLGSYTSADLPVLVNGEEVGVISIPSTQPDGISLLAAGWSFGMCAGYCVADLVISGDDLVLTGTTWTAESPLLVNRGSLTPEGRAALDASLEGLDLGALEPVYGCPDCADGGAAYLELGEAGMTQRVQMEFGAPPEPLAESYALAMSFIDALEACQSTELVLVADDCAPYERP